VRVESLLDSASAGQHAIERCIAAATLLETLDRVRENRRRPHSEKQIQIAAQEFDRKYTATAEHDHSAIICDEAQRCRVRARDHRAHRRREDAWLALRSARQLYESALRAPLAPDSAGGAAGERQVRDLDRIERRVRMLERERGAENPLVRKCLLEIRLIHLAQALSVPALAHDSLRRIRLALEESSRPARNHRAVPPRGPQGELDRLDDLLAQAAPYVQGFPRQRHLYDRALLHRREAAEALRAGEMRRAHRRLADGTRLALRLLEESPGVCASRLVERVVDLLAVARERVSASPPDPRLHSMLKKAVQMKQEAEEANLQGHYDQAKKHGREAEDLLFNILALTR
jgi:hypothetical protein